MSWWRRYRVLILVPAIIVIGLLILLWLAPGSGDEGPFTYQFY